MSPCPWWCAMGAGWASVWETHRPAAERGGLPYALPALWNWPGQSTRYKPKKWPTHSGNPINETQRYKRSHHQTHQELLLPRKGTEGKALQRREVACVYSHAIPVLDYLEWRIPGVKSMCSQELIPWLNLSKRNMALRYWWHRIPSTPEGGRTIQSKHSLTMYPQHSLSAAANLSFASLVLPLQSWGRSLQSRGPGHPPRQPELGQLGPPDCGIKLLLANCQSPSGPVPSTRESRVWLPRRGLDGCQSLAQSKCWTLAGEQQFVMLWREKSAFPGSVTWEEEPVNWSPLCDWAPTSQSCVSLRRGSYSFSGGMGLPPICDSETTTTWF